MVADKAYYDTLGISPTATEAEIKTAYRRMALKYHPDKNSDPEASEMFKKCAEAYETLSDPEKRKNYDQFGKAGVDGSGGGAGGMGGGFRPGFNPEDIFAQFFSGMGRGGGGAGGGKPKPKDIVIVLEVSLEELYCGTKKEINVSRSRKCSNCDGTGSADKKPTTCSGCKGSGTQVRLQRFANGMAVQQQIRCPQCNGVGKRAPARPCRQTSSGVGCDGTGYISQKKKFTIEIKRGMGDGEAFRFEADGDEKEHYDTAGDVLVVLEELPHPYFKRINSSGGGKDLIVKGVKIPLIHALQGIEVPIQHLDGRIILARADRNTCFQPAFVNFIKNSGMPDSAASSYSSGKLYLDIEVVFPRIVSEKEKADELKKIEKERAAAAASTATAVGGGDTSLQHVTTPKNTVTQKQLAAIQVVLEDLFASSSSSSSVVAEVPSAKEIADSKGRIVEVKLVDHEYGAHAGKGQLFFKAPTDAAAAAANAASPSSSASADATGGAQKRKGQQKQQQRGGGNFGQQQQQGGFGQMPNMGGGGGFPPGMGGGVHVQECNQQ